LKINNFGTSSKNSKERLCGVGGKERNVDTGFLLIVKTEGLYTGEKTMGRMTLYRYVIEGSSIGEEGRRERPSVY